jgi:hypothetical protein
MPQAPARRAASESSDVAKLVRLHHRRRGRPGEREGQRLALPAARSRVALSAVPPWQLGGRHLHARRDDCHHRVDPAPEVNSWAYVVGAEHHDTFNPVSYRQACGGLPSRTGGGCRIVTEGYLSNSGGDVTWASQVPLDHPFSVRDPLWAWGTWRNVDAYTGDGSAIPTIVAGLFFDGVTLLLLYALVVIGSPPGPSRPSPRRTR